MSLVWNGIFKTESGMKLVFLLDSMLCGQKYNGNLLRKHINHLYREFGNSIICKFAIREDLFVSEFNKNIVRSTYKTHKEIERYVICMDMTRDLFYDFAHGLYKPKRKSSRKKNSPVLTVISETTDVNSQFSRM